MPSTESISPSAAAAPALRSAGGRASDEQRDDEAGLIDALAAGDEAAFRELIERHQPAMIRLAQTYVGSHAVAEEVTQETWVAVLTQLDGFERRSTLKTWVFRILVNRAKTRAVRERRMVPASALRGSEDPSPTVDPSRFQGPDGEYPSHWASEPRPWNDPARRLASLELRMELRLALERLPARQCAVVALRDVEGLTAEEVCDLLDLSPANQRVLLHRGRAALRNTLDPQLCNPL